MDREATPSTQRLTGTKATPPILELIGGETTPPTFHLKGTDATPPSLKLIGGESTPPTHRLTGTEATPPTLEHSYDPSPKSNQANLYTEYNPLHVCNS